MTQFKLSSGGYRKTSTARAIVAAAVLLMIPALAQAQDAKPSPVEYRKTTLHDNYMAWMPNGVIVGKHGLNEGNLIVGSVITNAVRVVDPDTGKIIRSWQGQADGMAGADDIAEGPDGSIYHVNANGVGIGRIHPDGTTSVVPGTKEVTQGEWTNAVAISKDGKTLFFTQAIGQDAVYSIDLSDPNAKAVKHGENIGWHNSSDFGADGMVYGGNNVYGGLMQFNPKTGEDKVIFHDGLEFVSSAEINDATGLVYVTEFHLGHTSEIDLKTGMRRVISTTEPFLDNVGVEDKQDPRIFAASYAYDTLYEVYANGDTPRVIIKGDGSLPEGIAIMKSEGGERIFIKDRFRLREYFPQTGTYRAIAHTSFQQFIEGDRAKFYDADRVTWRNKVKGYINLNWMRSLHQVVGEEKFVIAGAIMDHAPGRVLIFDLKQNKPIRTEVDFKATTADAIMVGDDIYVANGDVITRVDPKGKRTDVYTGKSPHAFAQSAAGAWVTDYEAGTLLQVAEGDQWLGEPRVVLSGLNKPHGINLANDGNLLLIEEKSAADATTGRLLKIDRKSGQKTIIQDGLQITFSSNLLEPVAQVAQSADGSIYITEPGDKSMSLIQPRH